MRKCFLQQGRVAIATVGVLAMGAVAADITVNPNVQFQTIDGFGAHGAQNVWWSNGPFYDNTFIDKLLDDLGMTIFRNEYYPDESNNAMGYGVGQWNKQLPYLREVKRKADEKGIDVKFIVTLWSPPGGMKWNNVTLGGDATWNRVSNGLGPEADYVLRDRGVRGAKPDHYPDLANYCVEAVERYKRDVGEDLYAFSFANEPRFAQQGFNSCVWSDGQYRDFIKILGAKFREKNFTTKIFGPEDMAATTGTGDYLKGLGQDPDKTAMGYLDILAAHGYSNGVNPSFSDATSTRMGG